MHLFVSPDDPDHVQELANFLARLHFDAHDDSFPCSRAGLIALGRKADPKIDNDDAALRYGAEKFKVNFRELRREFTASAWAQKHIRVAVAGAADDGTSGVRAAADKTLREEIEKFADVIFAGSPLQRDFWLGQRSKGPDEIRARYRGLKPCLHGSDAHRLDDVATPSASGIPGSRGAQLRLAPAGVHRAPRAGVCRSRSSGVGHAVAGHRKGRGHRHPVDADARAAPQRRPGRHNRGPWLGQDGACGSHRRRLRLDPEKKPGRLRSGRIRRFWSAPGH